MKLEISVNGSWVEVNDWIFRSWSGHRRLNGGAYFGPVFLLGKDDIAVPFGTTAATGLGRA